MDEVRSALDDLGGNRAARFRRRDALVFEQSFFRGEIPVVGELFFQLLDNGARDLHLQVAPLAESRILPGILASQVHASDKSQAAVDHLQLAVVAQIEKKAVA